MSRRDLNDINLSGLHTLTIGVGDQEITFQNLVFSKPAVNVTPGFRSDESATYFVELSDARYLALNPYFSNPINRQYNVYAPDSGQGINGYYSLSLNAGAKWTWQEMLDDIWEYVNVPELGASPQLGYDLNGEPEGFKFIGVSAWQAYNEVLRKIGFAFVLYPNGDSSIVRIGEPDEIFADTTARYDEDRILDDEPIDPIRHRVPEKVVVYFPKEYLHYGSEVTTNWDASQWSSNPVEEVEIEATLIYPDIDVDSIQPGSKVCLWDDQHAYISFYQAILNDAQIVNRAYERAANYYRDVYLAGERFYRVYDGFIGDQGFLPGSQVSLVAWSDQGGGARTEVLNTPNRVYIDDTDGSWRELTEFSISDNTKNPDLARSTYPNYPLVDQFVKVTSASPTSNGMYSAVVQRYDPDLQIWYDAESCWVVDANQ